MADTATGPRPELGPGCLGVYVHFPFCAKLCPYCDFAVKVARPGSLPHDEYADLVLSELAARAPRFAGRRLETIYLGGGTPGMWRADAVARVLAGIRAAFPGPPLREVTCEVNPEDIDAAQMAALRAAGVDRLSIGVQSLADRALAELGRVHDAARARAAFAEARAAGFDNLSCDLITGLPGAPPGELAASLAEMAALGPEHVSAYTLTIEPRTKFGTLARTGRMTPLADDPLADDFELTDRVLTQAGYQHYEVSSFARPGFRALHNSRYWSGAEYLGLGCSAHSLRNLPDGRAERFASPRELRDWQRGVARLCAQPPPADPLGPLATPETPDPLAASVELLGAEERAFERLFLGLRTSDGIAAAELPSAAHAQAQDLINNGLLARRDGRLAPTAKGLLLADEMALRLREGGCTP